MSDGRAKLFLSYASEDEAVVEQFYDRVQRDGFRPWMAKRNIYPGEDWERAIWRAIREADFVLICLSTKAVAKRGFLQKEIRQALEIWKEKLEDDIYLIPIRFEECSVPRILSGFHCANLYESDGYGKLCGSIAEGMSRRGVELTRVLADGPVVLVSERIEEKEEGRFDLSIEYPILRPDTTDPAKSVNARIRRFAQEDARVFHTEWVNKGYDPAETQLWPSLETRYSIGLFTKSMLTIRFTKWSFHPGAAHPNSNTHTFNFFLDPFAEYELSDLFREDVDHLNAISQYCINNLHLQCSISRNGAAPDWIASEAGPRHSNFQKFLLIPDGLDIIFDAYRYVEDRWEVQVPKTILSTIMKPRILAALDES